MENDLHSQLMTKVDAFQARHGLSDRKPGRLLSNSTHAISRLRAGQATLLTVKAIEVFMEKHKDVLPN